MVTLLLAALASVDPMPRVRNYYCAGTRYSGGTGADGTAVLIYQPDNLQFRIKTLHGRAGGQGQATQESYVARLVAADGTRYGLKLSRYTGEFTLIVDTGAGLVRGEVEFAGTCREVQVGR